MIFFLMKTSINGKFAEKKMLIFFKKVVHFLCECVQKILILLLNSLENRRREGILLSMLLFFNNLAVFSQFTSEDYLASVLKWELDNPSKLAYNKRTNVIGEFQRQWAGFSGGPQSLTFAFNSHLPSSRDQAAGVSYSEQSEGFWKFKRFAFQYAYRIPIKNGCVGLGLDAGFGDSKIDFSDANFSGSDELGGDTYHNTSDVVVTGGSDDESDILFDLNFGASLVLNKMNFGLSVQHLNQPKAQPSDSYQFAVKPLLFMYGEYKFVNHSKTLVYEPAVMVRSDFSNLQVGMMNTCTYNDKLVFGLNAWFWSSLSFVLGYEVYKGVQLAYSYGLPTSRMIKSGGSHFITLKYSFDLNFKRNNRYVDSRIL